MFAVIYSFRIQPSMEREFIKGWKGLTEFIYRHENSLGSRLHKASDDLYIAYAQWPDRQTWENAGQNMPEEAKPYREMMRQSCEEIKTLHELEMTEDLLQSEAFGGIDQIPG